MIVAALGNGNDAVGVTDTVDDLRVARRQSRVSVEPWSGAFPDGGTGSFTVSVTTTVSFPFPSAATITTDRSR